MAWQLHPARRSSSRQPSPPVTSPIGRTAQARAAVRRRAAASCRIGPFCNSPSRCPVSPSSGVQNLCPKSTSQNQPCHMVRGRILFDEWADHWWQLWSSSPRRSPKGMETTESHLRCHLRPYFGRRQLRQITPSIVLRWQNELEGKLSHSGVMACRSILLRIFEAARRERLIPTNPVRDVEAPKPRLGPERVFGHQRRRTL